VRALLVLLAAAGCAKHARDDGRPHAVEWPVGYDVCSTDADCVMISLGCCDETAVARAKERESRDALDRSGRPWCAVKGACGPSSDGTWNGSPARCLGGHCAPPADFHR
jgi:hypothetical protein